MTLTKVNGMLGLAQRAGVLVAGSNQVLASIVRPGNYLLLIAADADSTTTGQVVARAVRAGIPVYTIPVSKADLGRVIGKTQRSCVMVRHSGFARRISSLLEEMEVRPIDKDQNL